MLSDVGIIVPEKDEALWGRALEQLLSDPDQRAEAFQARAGASAKACTPWPEVARQAPGVFFRSCSTETARGSIVTNNTSVAEARRFEGKLRQ